MQGTFCKLCECWVPGKQHDRVWQQHVHSTRHKRAVATSNYRSEAPLLHLLLDPDEDSTVIVKPA